MAKIIRDFGNLQAFSSEALSGERSVFGDNSNFSNSLTNNLNNAFKRGWGDGVDPNGYPPMEYFNALGFTTTQLISYLFQTGIAEWNSQQEYYVDSICNYNGVLYKSLYGGGSTPNLNRNPEENLGTFWENILKRTSLLNDIQVTVGINGDYSTVNSAIEDLSQKYMPTYKNSGIRATITMLSGFSLTEQLIFQGIDCSWIRLTSIDAEVPIVTSALTRNIYNHYPAIASIDGGNSCFIDFVGNMDNSTAEKTGFLTVNGGNISGETLGIKNAGAVGILCDSGNISCRGEMNNSGAGKQGILCYSGNVSCRGEMNNSGAGEQGILCLSGNVFCYQNMNNSGAGEQGILCYGGNVSCYQNMNNSGAGEQGILCQGGNASCHGVMDNRCGATDEATDTAVLFGGYITRGDGNGGTNQATGTITENGYINK